MKKLTLLFCLAANFSLAADVIPSAPSKYFDDRVGIIDQENASKFNEQLAKIERETTNQFVITVLPLNTSSTMEDYCNKIAKSWKVGQKDKNNGAIFFWFPKERKMRFEVGYGLESVLPDTLTKRITSNYVVPEFKNKNWNGGLQKLINQVNLALTPKIEKDYIPTKEAENNSVNSIFMFLLALIIITGLVVVIGLISKHKNDEARRLQEEKFKEIDRQARLRRIKEAENKIRLKENPVKKEQKHNNISNYVPYVAPIIAAPIINPVETKPTIKPTKKKSSSYSGPERDDSYSFPSFDFGSSSSSSSDFSSGGGDFGGGGSSDSY